MASQMTNAGMVKIIIQEKANDNDVAPTETTFLVHCALLTLHSQYFKNALKGEWKEAQSRTITLTDVNCTTCKSCFKCQGLSANSVTVEIFVNRLYTDKLPLQLRDWSQLPASGCLDTDEMESDLSKVRCVIFGDSYAATKFQIECEREIITNLVNDGVPYFEPIILAFANLPPTNNLLRAMVDSHVHGYEDDNENADHIKMCAKLPHDFLVQIMVRYSQVAHKKVEAALHACDYHHHANNKEKTGCHAAEEARRKRLSLVW